MELARSGGWKRPHTAAASHRSSFSFERNALRRDDLLYHEVALGDGAGLIHDDGLYVIERLERRAALEQDATPRACADAGEVGQRHAEHQRARARDNEEGHRGVYPFMPLAGEQARARWRSAARSRRPPGCRHGKNG